MTEQQNNMIAPILATIVNEDIREFAQMLVEGLPSYIWEVGASSTGKYHPAFSLGEGGLLRHTKVAVKIAKVLLENPTFGDDNLYLGQLDGAAEENKTFDVTFTLWFEGAHTLEDVTDYEFDIILYFYCLRVVE